MALPLAALTALGRRLRRDRRGNYSMIVAIMLPVLTGFVALGTEAGLWLYDQQVEQTAADSAAFSAAVYYAGQGASANSTTMTQAQDQAIAVVANYGFGGSLAGSTSCTITHANTVSSCSATGSLGACSITAPATGTSCVMINNPPSGGPNAGVSTCPPTSATTGCYIEVVVSEQPQQLFSAVLSSSPVTIAARAVGEVTYAAAPANQTGNSCVLVTDTGSDQGALNVAGNATVNASSCNLAVNDPGTSGVTVQNNAAVTFSRIYDDAPSLASNSVSSNATLNGTTTFGASTQNPYSLTIPSLTTATSGGCGYTAATTATYNSTNANQITSIASMTGIQVGMFAYATSGHLSTTLPLQDDVTVVGTNSVTLGTSSVIGSLTNSVATEFGVNPYAMDITANTTLQPGYYTGIDASGNAIVLLEPGTYYICPIPTTATASGTTTSSSTTVTIPSSTIPTGWVTGMVITDADSAIPANTTIAGLGVTGTLSANATKTVASDTFTVSGSTATGSITSGSKTITFTSIPSWSSGTITDSGGGVAASTTVTVSTVVTLSQKATAAKTSDTLSVSGAGTFSGTGNAVFYTAPYINSSGTIGLNSDCGTNPYTTGKTDCFVSGDGVTIVLLGSATSGNSPTNCASFTLSGGANAFLVPPNASGNPSGFNGVAITSTQNCTSPSVGTTTGAGTLNVSGNGSLQIFGAIDLATYGVSFGGNASNGSGCLQLIAHSLSLTGTTNLGQNCTGVGTSAINQLNSGAATYSAALAN